MLRNVIIAGIFLAGCAVDELDVAVEVSEIQSEDNAGAVLEGSSKTGVCKLDAVRPSDTGGMPDDLHCSCIVVAPTLILTSAVCVVDLDGNPLSDITIGFGPDGQGDVRTGPFPIEVHRYFDIDNPSVFQLAFVQLATAAPDTPLPLNDTDISNLMGEMVQLVGFGETDNDLGDFTSRRAVTLPINLVERDAIRVGDELNRNCDGDSGGPVLYDFGSGDTVIAVSRRQTNCSETVSMTRTDRNTTDFLFPYIDQKTGPCAADGTCTMDCPRTPDPDCPDNECLWGNECKDDCPTRDWDCEPGSFPGQECAISGDCEQGGACIAAADDPTFLYCDKPCESDQDCPAMMTCSDAGRCEYGTPSPGSQGFPCTMNEECRSGICEDLICVRNCDPAASDCPSEFTCGPSKVSEGEFVCLGEDLSGGGGFCQVGSTRGAGTSALLLLLALFWVRRRRNPRER